MMSITGTDFLAVNGVSVTSSTDAVPKLSVFLESTSGAYTTTRTHSNASILLFWDRHIRRLSQSVRILADRNPGSFNRPMKYDSIIQVVQRSLEVGLVRKKSNPTMLTANLFTALPSNYFSLPRRFSSSVSFRPTPFLVISSAKKIRGRRRPPPRVDRSNTAAVEEEGGAFAYLSPPGDVYSNEEHPKSSMKEGMSEKEEETGGGVLRGSDVLIAMQKAISQKENKGKRRDGRRKSVGYRKNDANAMNSDFVGRDAKPIEIRKDWEPRLEALEKRIQELQEEEHD